MRLVIDLQACQSAPHRERGIGRYSMAFVKALVRNIGNDEVWVALNGDIVETIDPIRKELAGLIDESRIAVWRSVPDSASSDPANRWRSAAARKVLNAFLAQLKPDVVHVSSLFEGYFDNVTTTIDSRNAFVTSVSLYDLIPLQLSAVYLADPRMRDWYRGKLEELKQADVVLGISRYTCGIASELLQIPLEHTVPVMAAADPIFSQRKFEPGESEALLSRHGIFRPFVMFTGGIDPRKNVEGLIKAYGLLEQSLRQRFQLVIVCAAEPKQAQVLRALASRCGLHADDLVLTGYVSDADLIALYNLCHAFVFPSLSEGFGFPPLEAMACGAAVIASDTSSIPEVIGDDDALFDPRDPASIFRKLNLVLNDNVFRARLRERGLCRARAFSWDQCAQTALVTMRAAAGRRHECAGRKVSIANGARKPRLACVSPLPPQRSGIADYTAELLPALSEFYEIEAVSDQAEVTNPWVSEHIPLRTCAWFEQNADRYDRVLYHMGNNSLHAHTFGMVQRHPGVVVLHEVFLSGLIAHLELTGEIPGFWTRNLYDSHGYVALLDRHALGDSAQVMERYPCSLSLIRDAEGIIVHNHHCKRIAERWFGAQTTRNWAVAPLLRATPERVEREAARVRLGVAENALLTCCFGIINPFKCNREILDAWLASTYGSDGNCILVFVGGSHHQEYGDALARMITENNVSERVRITGWVDSGTYHDYLAAADLAVQLRTSSRGETSASVLDCLAYAVPTIVNAHGSMAELPPNAVKAIPEAFTTVELADALEVLASDTTARRELGQRARAYCRESLAPGRVAECYRDAIEHISANGPHRSLAKLANEIATIEGRPEQSDIDNVVAAVAANRRRVAGTRQLLVDVSELVRRDAKSGIQRVVRRVLDVLLRQPPQGFRVEPVYADSGQRYRYARSFTMEFLGLSNSTFSDEVIDTDSGDVFLGLDLVPDVIPDGLAELEAMRHRGVKIFFVVYDQLPLLRWDCFPPRAYDLFNCWMMAVATVCDGLICISRSVEVEVRQHLDLLQLPRARPIKLGHFHLGADLSSSDARTGVTPEQKFCIERLRLESTFLVVGTIEPRKGHEQTLDAFELLWARGCLANLVLVGKPGWMTERLVQRIRDHVQTGKHLLWFEQASDELLMSLYSASSALLASSEGEGFGLPLIEAAQRELPILCRDLPVFREVAGKHASYFSGHDASDLADAVERWLTLDAAGAAPSSKPISWLNWEQATHQLLEVALHERWDDAWNAGDRYWFPAYDPNAVVEAGERVRGRVLSSGTPGVLLRTRQREIPGGRYQLQVRGRWCSAAGLAHVALMAGPTHRAVANFRFGSGQNADELLVDEIIEIPDSAEVALQVLASKDAHLEIEGCGVTRVGSDRNGIDSATTTANHRQTLTASSNTPR